MREHKELCNRFLTFKNLIKIPSTKIINSPKGKMRLYHKANRLIAHSTLWDQKDPVNQNNKIELPFHDLAERVVRVRFKNLLIAFHNPGLLANQPTIRIKGERKMRLLFLMGRMVSTIYHIRGITTLGRCSRVTESEFV